MNMKKKTVVLLLVLVLAAGIAVGGTVAYLLDTTDPIINTFTAGDVDIELSETGADNNTNSYKMVPGATIIKDPKVTVSDTSESCYVFVKLDKSANFDTFLTYTVAAGWIQGTGSGDGVPANVYYRTVNAEDETRAFSVLNGDEVSVNPNVTKEQLNALTGSTYPTLTVTAYACQLARSSSESFTAGEAWMQVSGSVSGA